MAEQNSDAALDAVQRRLRELGAAAPAERKNFMLELMRMAAEPLRGELAAMTSPETPDYRSNLVDHLAWIESVRTTVLIPLEEAAAEGRAAGIRAGMREGLPGSAFTDSTGLTLARIYQIRDGRR